MKKIILAGIVGLTISVSAFAQDQNVTDRSLLRDLIQIQVQLLQDPSKCVYWNIAVTGQSWHDTAMFYIQHLPKSRIIDQCFRKVAETDVYCGHPILNEIN